LACFLITPAFSKLNIEKILERNLMEISSSSFYDDNVKCSSTSANGLGATSGSPPGKKTLSISRNKNTCS